jgi:co-chaperonin GroES (HSP10)
MKADLYPCGKYVGVLECDPPTQCNDKHDDVRFCKVISVGPTAFENIGWKFIDPPFKEGDGVLVEEFSGKRLTVEGVQGRFITYDDVIGVMRASDNGRFEFDIMKPPVDDEPELVPIRKKRGKKNE